MSILLFFVVLFVLILVHEWGHFIAAKKTGMRVDEFGIGFPPKLFGVRKGETEYTFNALPIGGFVRILGENFVEEVPEVDRARAFGARPKWAQAIVLIAGVTMNVLFAWLLFSMTLMLGVPTAVDETEAGPDAVLYFSGVIPDSPAAVIPAGAEIVSVESAGDIYANPTPTVFRDIVTNSDGETITVSYRVGADADLQTADISPVQGLVSEDAERYVVGANLAMVENKQLPIHLAILRGAETTISGLGSIVLGLSSLISQAFVGEADFSQVAGPVGIVGMVGDAAAFGVTALLTFTAIISLNLAVINMLPFPALDGGRLVFVAIEAITGKQIPPEWAGRVNLVGFAILMLLMIAVTYNDIIRLL